MQEVKQCSTPGCDGASGFWKTSKTKSGLQAKCKDCRREKDREYRKSNYARECARVKEWNAKNAEKRRERSKTWREANAERVKSYQEKRVESGKHFEYRLKRVYGITPDDYFSMFDRQNESCAICKEEVRLYVDHCHATGKVRGLLCRSCNLALGFLRDDEARIMGMLDYLQGDEDETYKNN